MSTVRIMSVVGARPNFMKIAPFARAIADHNAAGRSPAVEHRLVHTGQHYDMEMSQTFFEELEIPQPDRNLEIGSGTHAQQVGHTMIAFETAMREWPPDWVVVVGDVNATCACSITAKKEHVKLAHIEAGLRSGDMRMPEEVNRLVTDRLSDLLLTPDSFADANLAAEGVAPSRVEQIGNIMIDTLEAQRARAEALDLADIIAGRALASVPRTVPGRYAVMTLHRPSNVDQADTLAPLMDVILDTIAPELPLLWTLHPRTRQALERFELWERVTSAPGVTLLGPLGYREMLRLNLTASLMLTDSGGLQEECCVLGTPCLTLRENTERPITLVEHGGVSALVGNDPSRVLSGYRSLVTSTRKAVAPPGWDGGTAERALAAILARSRVNS